MRDPVRAGLEEVEVLGNPRVLGIGVWGYLDRVLKSSIAVCPVSWGLCRSSGQCLYLANIGRLVDDEAGRTHVRIKDVEHKT